MNASTSAQTKQVGNRVKITSGQHLDRIGTITAKASRAWMVELEDGSQVTVAFSMIVLIEETGLKMAGEQAQELATITMDEAAVSAVANDETASIEQVVNAPAEEAGQVAVKVEAGAERQPESAVDDQLEVAADPKEGDAPDLEESATGDDTSSFETASTAISPDIAKMTVRQLWDLAKQRGVSVARTKADFFTIIKVINPDEDMAVLKGKALFDRVSELHISRLRSKQEMVILLSA